MCNEGKKYSFLQELTMTFDFDLVTVVAMLALTFGAYNILEQANDRVAIQTESTHFKTENTILTNSDISTIIK